MQDYRSIYVLGGHKLAVSYTEKLKKAKADGAISFDGIFNVTDDEKSLAHQNLPPQSVIRLHPAEFIVNMAQQKTVDARDTLVPDHTAKHVMLQAYLLWVKKFFPEWETVMHPFQSDFQTPFLYKSENDSLWAMSYATWTCPPDCNEPTICPHTQSSRDWDFFENLKAELQSYHAPEYSTHLFGCQALNDEISHIPLSIIVRDFQQFMQKLQSHPPQKVIVATHSHCHSILGQFKIQPKPLK